MIRALPNDGGEAPPYPGAQRAPEVHALGHAAGAVRPFRLGSRTHLAIIAKATFRLVHKQRMTPLPPVEVVTADVHTGTDPRGPLLIAAENAPFLLRTDVIVTGHAWARAQIPVPLVPVRVRVGRDHAVFLDKTLHVYGDRRGNDPAPFVSMPLTYDRAIGGAADPENPAGRDPRLGQLPNLIHPQRPNCAVGLGPISPAWPSRRRFIGHLAHRDSAKVDNGDIAAAWPSIPRDFDWSFFQAAPADQQIGHLTGQEWIVLEGFSPTLPRLDACLPGAVAEARLWTGGAERAPVPVPLLADMWIVDAAQGTSSVVWRGHVELAEEAFAAAKVAVRVTMPGEHVTWEPQRPRPSRPVTLIASDIFRPDPHVGASGPLRGLAPQTPYPHLARGLPFAAAPEPPAETLDAAEPALDSAPVAVPFVAPSPPAAPAPSVPVPPRSALPSYARKQQVSTPPLAAAPPEAPAAPRGTIAHAPIAENRPARRPEPLRKKARARRPPLRADERPTSAPLVPPRERRPAAVAAEGIGASFLVAAGAADNADEGSIDADEGT